MSTMNQANLLGRLTKDPELKKTNSGTSFCRYTIACDRRKTKQEQDPGADFISCVAWGQSADFLTNYAEKGSLVLITGRIQTGSYTDRDGKKVYTTEVVADHLQVIGENKKKKSDYGTGGQSKSLEELSKESDYGFDVGTGDDDIGSDDLPF